MTAREAYEAIRDLYRASPKDSDGACVLEQALLAARVELSALGLQSQGFHVVRIPSDIEVYRDADEYRAACSARAATSMEADE